jgi:drug/metabolite transporter (DMT)-like permease
MRLRASPLICVHGPRLLGAEGRGSNPAVPTSPVIIRRVAVLLAAAAAVSFGALAVAIRVALVPGLDPDAATLVTTMVACAVCAATAALFGQWDDVPWGDVWPFVLAGTFAPGITQILFTRSIGLIGPSRTTILVGTSPVLSVAIAIVFLDEPVEVALVIGTLLVVGGGAMLAWERGGLRGMLTLGVVFAVAAAVLFGIRDNVVRWAERGSDVPGVVAAAVSLATAIVVIAAVVAARGDAVARTRAVARRFLLPGLIYGCAYVFLLTAFDHGRVTVVAPLYGTESLWAVVFSSIVLRYVEAVGVRLVACGALISGFR